MGESVEHAEVFNAAMEKPMRVEDTLRMLQQFHPLLLAQT
jgi:hypothetical protein